MSCINSITVYPGGVTITKGQWYYDAFASVSSSCSECAEVRWYSLDSCIASVNETTGDIFGVSTGTTKVYAETADGAKDYITVTVVEPTHVTGIEICPTSLTMNVGDTDCLSASVYPWFATNKTVTWCSSDDSVASVNYYTGQISAKKAGTTTITATTVDGGFTASCTVTVNKLETTTCTSSITVYPGGVTITKGQWYCDAFATTSPCGSECAEVKWYSFDSCIASVNETTGDIFGVNTGTTEVYAETADGAKDYITVTVINPIPVTGIEICPTSLTMNVGDTDYLSASVYPWFATNQTVTWCSSDEDVATVDYYSGLITAKKPGTVTIRATTVDGEYCDNAVIQVLLEIGSILIYQSPRSAGKDECGNVAGDMIINDKDKSELISMNPILGDMAILYDLPPASSTLLPPQGPIAVYDGMRQLADIFSKDDSSMKKVVEEMIEHFIDGDGTSYSNQILTQKVINHQSTQNLINGTKTHIVDFLKNNNGLVNLMLEDNDFQDKIYDVGIPHYDRDLDMSNGLKISINGVWGYRMYIQDYRCDGHSFSGTIKYTLYDHFGLDDGDVTDEDGWFLGWTKQFSSWYVLQHYKGCNGLHKPFITYINAETEFSGNIN